MISRITFFVSVTLTASCSLNRKEYYFDSSNGDKKLKYSYEVNRLNGKKCGQFVWFFENGDTIQNSYFKNGKLHGVSKFYFEHNKLQVYVECLNDLQHGATKEFYENGQLRIECTYNLNRLWEIASLYDSAGNSLDYGYLKNGNGFIKNYYPDGSLKHEGRIKNGYRDGLWHFYTNTGIPMESTLYIDGYGPESLIIENHY